MKKFLFLPLAVLVTMFAWIPAEAAAPTRMNILPEKARKFVADHFPSHVISYVIGEKDFGSPMEYEVMFTDKTYVTFDKGGKWTEVQCGLSPVPGAIIPEQIRKYVKDKFPAEILITEIERNHRGYSVELSNDVELKFDRSGKFRKAEY